MNDDNLRDQLTQAYMDREGCERVVDDHFTSYCNEHHTGWLHDVNACAHADVTVTLALMPVVRDALTQARGPRVTATIDGRDGRHEAVLEWRHHSTCEQPGWCYAEHPDSCIHDSEIVTMRPYIGEWE